MSTLKTLTLNGVQYEVTSLIPKDSITLLASAWNGESGSYYQTVTVGGITSQTKIDLQPTPAQLVEFHYKVLAFVAENDNGTVKVYAIGDKPTSNHTIQITKTEVEGTGKIRGNTVGTTMPRPDWNQEDPSSADYIHNKPYIPSTGDSGITCESSGEIVSVRDASDLPLQGLTIYGKTTQFTSTGKNLLEPLATNKTQNGLKFTTNNDCSITVNGTSTSAGIIAVGYFQATSGQSYTLNGCPTGGSESKYSLTLRGSVTQYDYGSGATYVASGNEMLAVYIDVNAGVTLSNLVFRPMVRLSSVADASYEPYTGGVATPSPDYPQELNSMGASGAIKTTVCGKNLLNLSKENLTADIIFMGTAGKLVGTYVGVALILPPGTYTIRATGTPTGSDYIYCQANDYALTKYLGAYSPVVGSNLRTYTMTFHEWVRVFLYDANTTVENGNNVNYAFKGFSRYNIQLEVGATATEFEPYKSQTLTASTTNGLPGIPVSSGGNYTDASGQQWICDEIDFGRGVYVQRIEKKTFNSKAGWSVSFVSSSGLYKFATTIQNAQPDNGAVLCNLVKGVSFNDRSFSTDGICFMYAVENVFSVMTSAATTLDEWGALLAETPMELLFAAATPIETALSAEELAQFASLHTNKPNTTVFNDAGAEMKLSYVADTKAYIDNKFNELATALVNNM